MNLYAIVPSRAPGDGVTFVLCEAPEEALTHAVRVAAEDRVNGHGSPTANVFQLIAGVEFIGEAGVLKINRSSSEDKPHGN